MVNGRGKAESRRPNPERRPSSEIRNEPAGVLRRSGFGLVSDFGDSAFGLHQACRVANCLARRMAARILEGFALPCPAISYAVPWSGEVRMNGRPRVQFTPCS